MATDLPAAVLSQPDGPHSLARIRNVSSTGLLLERVGKQLNRNESVWVEIPSASGRGRVGLLARVCWAVEDRAGVSIEAMFPHHRARLRGLLESLT